jgi:hypothetical protein
MGATLTGNGTTGCGTGAGIDGRQPLPVWIEPGGHVAPGFVGAMQPNSVCT